MGTLRNYRNSIIRKSFLYFSVAFLVLVVIIKTVKVSGNSIHYGFLFGFLVSLINFYLLSNDIVKVDTVARSKFRSLLLVRFFLRYVCIGLAVFAAVKYDFNIIAFLIGLFFFQIVIVIDNVTRKL